jgi:chorismate dehydratase
VARFEPTPDTKRMVEFANRDSIASVWDTDVAHSFSVLPYVNALPLVHFLTESSPGAELVYCSPRHAVAALLDKRVDAALIPVVDLYAHPELRMIAGLGIAADGDVTSVLLQCHRPLRMVATIGLDSESKTSNILIRVLARDHFRLSEHVRYTREATEVEANVCIGDRALCASPALESYDLAGAWKTMTGLPFVFAVWAVHQSCRDVVNITRILQTAKQRGCRARRQLARLCSQRLGLTEDRCYDYLVNRLRYGLGLRELEGMTLFRRLSLDFMTPVKDLEIHEIAGHPDRHDTIILERS